MPVKLWEKGQSGNPSGRRKVNVELRDLAMLHAVHAISALVECLSCENPSVRVSAANSILDRGYGKPAQTVHKHVSRSVTNLTTDELMVIAAGGSVGVAEQGEGEDELSVIH